MKMLMLSLSTLLCIAQISGMGTQYPNDRNHRAIAGEPGCTATSAGDTLVKDSIKTTAFQKTESDAEQKKHAQNDQNLMRNKIVVEGEDNSISIVQSGKKCQTSITQSGSSNKITIIQKDDKKR